MLLRKIAWWTALGLIALLAVLVAAQTASAQEETGRKVKSRVSPVYPELAKQMNVSGAVKVQLTIAPDGTVKSAKALGGHPVLINSAIDAVKRWKYEPAKEETTTIVQFNFSPSS